MKIEMDKLLEQVRRHIIDEDNLEEGLSDIFNLISEIVPIWKISWLQYHHDLRLMRIIAQSLRTGSETTNFMYETSSGIIDLACSRDNPDSYIVNQPENHPVGNEISKRAGYFEWSAVFIIFKNATGSYASVMMTAEGRTDLRRNTPACFFL